MIRFISSVRLIAVVLMPSMLLMGMSCGAGGFSIPLAEQSDERPTHDDSGFEDRGSLAGEAHPQAPVDGKQPTPPEVR